MSTKPGPIEILGRGLDHVAYLVDGSLVVRFASGPDEDVEREAQVLEIVACVSPLAVPQPAFVQPDLGGLVYELLPGVPLLDVERRPAESIGRELGGLLKALHAVEPERVRGLVELDDDALAVWLADAAREYEAVASTLPGTARHAVERFLDAPPPEPRARLVFSHNDLGIEHVLVDPSSLSVTGVIDWSDAALCDPAYDFGLIFRDLGPAAVRAAFAAYGDAGDLEERAVFYGRCALLEDLAYGLETGRESYLRKSLAGLAWVF